MLFHFTGFLKRPPRNTAGDEILTPDAQCVKSPKVQGKRRGQAVMEFVLLVTITTLIFGVVFSVVRKSLFHLWVCEISPRVSAPGSCEKATDCWGKLAGDASPPAECSYQ